MMDEIKQGQTLFAWVMAWLASNDVHPGRHLCTEEDSP
jgi:hypothetical protein